MADKNLDLVDRLSALESLSIGDRLTALETSVSDILNRLSAPVSVAATAAVDGDAIDAFHRTAIVYILDKFFGSELQMIRQLHADAVANPDVAANAAAAQVDPATGANGPVENKTA